MMCLVIEGGFCLHRGVSDMWPPPGGQKYFIDFFFLDIVIENLVFIASGIMIGL